MKVNRGQNVSFVSSSSELTSRCFTGSTGEVPFRRFVSALLFVASSFICRRALLRLVVFHMSACFASSRRLSFVGMLCFVSSCHEFVASSFICRHALLHRVVFHLSAWSWAQQIAAVERRLDELKVYLRSSREDTLTC